MTGKDYIDLVIDLSEILGTICFIVIFVIGAVDIFNKFW